MANLIYVANASLDGYTEDKDGKFDWTAPSDEPFKFVTNIIRTTHTHLYGRRMYQTMMVWETLIWQRSLCPCATSLRPGRQPTKLCIPERWRRSPLAKRNLNKRSIQKRFDN